jgi:hypothetical protein
MPLYALALSATKSGETYIIPAHVVAPTKTMAQEAGLVEAKRRFPEGSGYANHLAMAGMVDDDSIKAAGWTHKRIRAKKAVD